MDGYGCVRSRTAADEPEEEEDATVVVAIKAASNRLFAGILITTQTHSHTTSINFEAFQIKLM